MSSRLHQSVLLAELDRLLEDRPSGLAIDCTAGYGGHTEILLRKVGPNGQVIAIDRDPNSISYLRDRFRSEIENGHLAILEGEFSNVAEGLPPFDLMIADLGASSPQFDNAERGFSLRTDGPLDMRMSMEGKTAADLIDELDENELADILYHWGEERKSRPIAKAIKKDKPQSTLSLAAIVQRFYPRGRRHPATRVFQALRIAVNHEGDELMAILAEISRLAKPNSIAAIISFHSLEDRPVKQNFKSLIADGKFSPIKPFPLKPSDDEQKENPRSRSAIARIIRRL